MGNSFQDIERILELWEERQDETFSFSQIYNQLKEDGWYSKKVDRCLSKMVKAGLLEKEKKGIKGARSKYKPTSPSHKFMIHSHFRRIRDYSEKTNVLLQENESFIVYGLPPKEQLTSLEKEILNQNLSCINDAFYNLYLLKHSIKAREKAGQPLDHRLLWYYLLQKVSNRVKDRMRYQVRRAKDYNDIERTLELARKINIKFEDAAELLEIEKRWLDFNNPPPIHDKGLWDSFDEACLAVLIMRRPEDIEEYGLSLYFLNELIKGYEDKNDPEDRSLFYLAETFYMSTRLRKSPWTLEEIYKIRKWLELRIGPKKGEKLARCIYYFWKQHQERKKKTEKMVLDMEPKEFKVKVLNAEETRALEDIEVKAAINCQIPEKTSSFQKPPLKFSN